MNIKNGTITGTSVETERREACRGARVCTRSTSRDHVNLVFHVGNIKIKGLWFRETSVKHFKKFITWRDDFLPLLWSKKTSFWKFLNGNEVTWPLIWEGLQLRTQRNWWWKLSHKLIIMKSRDDPSMSRTRYYSNNTLKNIPMLGFEARTLGLTRAHLERSTNDPIAIIENVVEFSSFWDRHMILLLLVYMSNVYIIFKIYPNRKCLFQNQFHSHFFTILSSSRISKFY